MAHFADKVIDVAVLIPSSEFSVVFTDRSLNHMSKSFQQVIRDISTTLKSVYNADGVAVVPGGGTYAMEAVARQIATGKKCLVIRNGWFSFRWTQIFDAGSIPSASTVLKARRQSDNRQEPFAPAPIEEVVATILSETPGVVIIYTDDSEVKNGSKFASHGIRIAAGVPLQCDEPADFQTFRLGLFGLDKLNKVDATVARLEEVLDKVI